MKEQANPHAGDLAPMLASEGSVERLKSTQWAFEGKWDGYRVLVDANHGKLNLRSRRGRDVTDEYPQLQALAADLADHHVILDGEAVALDESGVPSFGEMQNRARSTRLEYWAFDILYLDGRSLLRAKYSDRRRLLEALADGGGLIVPDLLPGDGPEALEYARKQRWEGVVAKKRDATYQPGRRSSSWIKDKIWNTQEVVIGGWRQGEGGRSSGIGALMLGIPADGGLQFVGRVGTGFTEKELTKLKGVLKPLETDESPFNKRLSNLDAKGVTFVRPELVGEVRLQRTDIRRQAASTELAGPAPGQGAGGGCLGRALGATCDRMPNLAFARHRRPRSVKQRFCCLCSVPLERSIGNSPKGMGTMAGGIASELAAAGFDDAVEVGRGGGGVVYRCHQKSLGRSVAIKVLASDLDEDDRERFLREGYAMGALSGHPNIVNILQVGVTESDRPFIVMPYHARGSLAERRTPRGPDRVAGGTAHRSEIVRGAGNRASDRHFAPRHQARECARQRLRRTATERLRDRAHRRWIQDDDRLLHRHALLHGARGARR